jgi:hypothetical protein
MNSLKIMTLIKIKGKQLFKSIFSHEKDTFIDFKQKHKKINVVKYKLDEEFLVNFRIFE